MNFHYTKGVQYYTFDSLEKHGVIAMAFTRNGGVSPAPWESLNVGGSVGDDPQRVKENRARAFSVAGRSIDSRYNVWQVHSSEVVYADRPRPVLENQKKADAILTDQPGVTLFMQFADCVPVLLYDPAHRAIGLVHSGWLGTVNRIARTAVNAMVDQFRTNPANLLACIGPSICRKHYPVGPEVVEKANEAFGDRANEVIIDTGLLSQFDLWKANQIVLRESGVESVESSGLCTACDPEKWFSHRGEGGKTGRFGVLFALKDS